MAFVEVQDLLPFSLCHLGAVRTKIDLVLANCRSASEEEAKGGATRDGRDRYDHESPGLDGRVAAQHEPEEPTDHEAHLRTLYGILLGMEDHMLQFFDLPGELGGVIEGDEVLLEALLLQCPLVGVVGVVNVRGKA